VPPILHSDLILCFSGLIAYTTNKSTTPVWQGYTLAGSFFVVTFFQSTFFHQNFHIGMTTGMRARSAAVAAVYKKVNKHG